MVERNFVVLRYEGKVPTMASCAKCQRKFFTPAHVLHQLIAVWSRGHRGKSQYSGRKKPDLSRSGRAYEFNYDLISVYKRGASMFGYVGIRTTAPVPARLRPAQNTLHHHSPRC
jgi:hypothetical protein